MEEFHSKCHMFITNMVTMTFVAFDEYVAVRVIFSELSDIFLIAY